MINQAVHAVQTHRLVEAHDLLEEVTLHPDEVNAYWQLGILLRRAGKHDEAIDVWRKALEIRPADQTFAQQLVTTLLQSKRVPRFRQLWRSSSRQLQETTTCACCLCEVYLALAIMLVRLGSR